MNIRRLALVAAWLVTFSYHHPAQAALTGNDLWRFCETETGNYGMCTAYIWGVFDVMLQIGGMYEGVQTEFPNNPVNNVMRFASVCPPKGATPAQAIAIVKLWLQNNPQQRHQTASYNDWRCD